MLLAVSSQSRHPKESAELAWFMTSPENQLEFAKIVSILPSTPASLSDPHFAAPPPGDAPTPAGKVALARHVSAESLREGMSFVPALPAWPELTAAFNERIKSALLDGAEVERVLADIGREWNGILDSHEPLGLEVMPVLPAGGTREGP
jgi:ABC-type glycerol-3-phosphate transport system substrate-binding protein